MVSAAFGLAPLPAVAPTALPAFSPTASPPPPSPPLPPASHSWALWPRLAIVRAWSRWAASASAHRAERRAQWRQAALAAQRPHGVCRLRQWRCHALDAARSAQAVDNLRALSRTRRTRAAWPRLWAGACEHRATAALATVASAAAAMAARRAAWRHWRRQAEGRLEAQLNTALASTWYRRQRLIASPGVWQLGCERLQEAAARRARATAHAEAQRMRRGQHSFEQHRQRQHSLGVALRALLRVAEGFFAREALTCWRDATASAIEAYAWWHHACRAAGRHHRQCSAPRRLLNWRTAAAHRREARQAAASLTVRMDFAIVRRGVRGWAHASRSQRGRDARARALGDVCERAARCAGRHACRRVLFDWQASSRRAAAAEARAIAAAGRAIDIASGLRRWRSRLSKVAHDDALAQNASEHRRRHAWRAWRGVAVRHRGGCIIATVAAARATHSAMARATGIWVQWWQRREARRQLQRRGAAADIAAVRACKLYLQPRCPRPAALFPFQTLSDPVCALASLPLLAPGRLVPM